MEQQQSFSHGLLYSVSPENFSKLHLHDDADLDGFDWDEYESQYAGATFAQVVLSFLKVTATKWGLAKTN
jgi:hypothetical protein